MDTKNELDFFLAADKFALGKQGRPRLMGDEIWRFQICLRHCEYYKNKGGVRKLLYFVWKLRKRRLCFKLGFDIPEGVFGAGLRINHFGNIVVNDSCAIGRWCDIHQGVNIGAGNPKERNAIEKYTPTIGDHVWIGPGAKIFGNVTIGSKVQVGANAVVGKSFGDDVTVAGAPARIISDKGTSSVDVTASPNRTKHFFEQYPKYKIYDR